MRHPPGVMSDRQALTESQVLDMLDTHEEEGEVSSQCRANYSGAVFTKGLSQVLGLTFVQKYSQIKPETWLRPFVNTTPGLQINKSSSFY